MSVFITSENLIKDLNFKQRLGVKADLIDEVLDVINQASEKFKEKPETGIKTENEQLFIGPFGGGLKKDDPCCNDTSEAQINLKIFLTTNNIDTAIAAVKHNIKHLELTQIDSLILAVPLISASHVSIGSVKDEDLSQGSDDLKNSVSGIIDLWNALAKEFVQDSKTVLNLGLCDLDTKVFKAIFDKAEIKPSSVQVNLKTCCTVPPDLQGFAKENNIKLHTHSDPLEVLDAGFQSKLPTFQDPQSNDTFHLDPLWMVKMQSFIKARGVLADKRYVIAFNRK